jgi:hypothetical protein
MYLHVAKESLARRRYGMQQHESPRSSILSTVTSHASGDDVPNHLWSLHAIHEHSSCQVIVNRESIEEDGKVQHGTKAF